MFFIEITLAAILTILSLAWLIQWRKNRSALYQLAKDVPPVPNLSYLPILGHAHNFLGSNEEILNTCMSRNCEDDFQHFWLGPELVLFVNTPEMMELILNNKSCLQKHFVYGFARHFTRFDGLISKDVTVWKPHRKDIQPFFRQSNLEDFFNVFLKKAEICLELLQSKSGCKVDILDVISKYALDGWCEVSCGVESNTQKLGTTITKDIVSTLDLLAKLMARSSIVFFFVHHYIYGLTNTGKEFTETRGRVANFTKEMVKKYKCLAKSQQETHHETPIVETFLGRLTNLASNGEIWNEELIEEELFEFIIAGTDTVGAVGTFVLTMLAMHKDVEQKVFEEVIEVLGPDGCFTHQDLSQLQYTEKVINETLRLFPAAPFFSRTVLEDVKIGKYMLPKGVGLLLGALHIHRSSLYYNDPLKFDPERFSPEEIAKRHKYAFIPFSAGPRNCVGLKYAMMSLKVFTSLMVRKFTFHTDLQKVEDIALKQGLFMSPVEDIELKILSRF